MRIYAVIGPIGDGFRQAGIEGFQFAAQVQCPLLVAIESFYFNENVIVFRELSLEPTYFLKDVFWRSSPDIPAACNLAQRAVAAIGAIVRTSASTQYGQSVVEVVDSPGLPDLHVRERKLV